jgi:AAA ATPase domain
MTSVTARIAAWAAPTFRICREQIPHLPPVSRKVSANIRFFGYQRILSDSSVYGRTVDPLGNPFSMSAGNPPAALTGRDAQIEQFRRLIGRLSNGLNEPSMILWGLRGVGKTVLLLEFESVADQEGWTPSEPIEIRSDTNFRSELADAAYAALLRLNRRKAIGERLKSFTDYSRASRPA